MSFCINCGNKLEEGYDFCPECGTRIVPDTDNKYNSSDYISMKLCPKCGEPMPSDAYYCLNCGVKFEDSFEDFTEVQKRINRYYGTWKNKWIALLLCVFFGWMGAHKYYEGRIIMGILYSLTLGLLFVGWFVDIFLLSFKPNPYLVKR